MSVVMKTVEASPEPDPEGSSSPESVSCESLGVVDGGNVDGSGDLLRFDLLLRYILPA